MLGDKPKLSWAESRRRMAALSDEEVFNIIAPPTVQPLPTVATVVIKPRKKAAPTPASDKPVRTRKHV